MSGYYSEQISGPRSRTETEFTERSWGGIVALVQRGAASGVFAEGFPEQCPDGRGVCGTDERSLRLAVLAEHPESSWPLDSTAVPEAPAALDLIEFLHDRASDPMQKDYHSYFGHHHLSFDSSRGRASFREQVNRILARNSLVYELRSDGRAQRLVEPVLQEQLQSGMPRSGDEAVDARISHAEEMFLDPDPAVARDALEKLWARSSGLRPSSIRARRAVPRA